MGRPAYSQPTRVAYTIIEGSTVVTKARRTEDDVPLITDARRVHHHSFASVEAAINTSHRMNSQA